MAKIDSRKKPDRLSLLAREVFDIEQTQSKNFFIFIDKFESFLKEINQPIRLSEIGVEETIFNEVAQRCSELTQSGTIGNYVRLNRYDIIELLKLAI